MATYSRGPGPVITALLRTSITSLSTVQRPPEAAIPAVRGLWGHRGLQSVLQIPAAQPLKSPGVKKSVQP